jgi:hypothetical protein
MIAALTPLDCDPPRVCRMCGYDCGLIGTGCGYDSFPHWWGLRRPGPVFYDRPMLFPDIELRTEEALPKPVPLRALVPAAVSFVGAGSMHRRWR